MKTKGKKLTAVFAVAAFCFICALGCLALGAKSTASAEQTPQMLRTQKIQPRAVTATKDFDFNSAQTQQLCAELTSNDIIEGENITIGDYIARVKTGYYKSTNSAEHGRVLGRILPIEIFYKIGKYKYVGKEYLFYSNTECSSCGDTCIEEQHTNYITEVIFVDYNSSFIPETEMATLRLNVLSADYKVSYTNGQYYANATLNHNGYALNPIIGGTVQNLHDLNEFDSAYSKYNDGGAIFKQIRLNYSGSYAKTDVNVEPLLNFALSFVFDKIADRVPGLSELKLVYDFMDALYNTVSVSKTEVLANNEDNILDNVKKSEQIADPTRDRLTKVFTFKPDGIDLYINDYIESKILLSEQDVPSQLFLDAKFDLVDCYGEKLFDEPIHIPFFHNVYEREYMHNYYSDSQIYILPSGKQVFNFRTELAADYKIFADDGCGIKLYQAYDVNNYSGTKEIKSNAGVYKLEQDKVYYIEISNLSDSQVLRTALHSKIVAPELQIGENVLSSEYSVFKLPDKNRFYNLLASEQDARIVVCSLQPGEAADAYFQIVGDATGELRFEKTNSNEMIAVVYGGGTLQMSSEIEVSFISVNAVEPVIIRNDVCLELPEPEQQNGYCFAGWFLNENYDGEAITAQNIAKTGGSRLTLYAQEIPVVYSVRFETYGGSQIPDLTYTVHDGIVLPIPEKQDFIFAGWYESEDFSGNAIERLLVGSVGDKVFYARWAQKSYVLELNGNSEEADNKRVVIASGSREVEYGKPFVLPVATADGFVFDGWYYGETKITDAEGNSLVPYSYPYVIELKAKWSREYFEFQLSGSSWTFMVKKGDKYWDYTPNGLLAQLLIDEDTKDEAFKAVYKKGYIYKTLTVDKEGKEIADNNAAREYADASGKALMYPQYEKEVYTLHLDDYFGEKKELKVHYGDVLPFVSCSKQGYTVDGWYDTITGIKFTYTTMPDITENEEGNGSLWLELRYSAIVYSITYITISKTTTGETVVSSNYSFTNKKTTYTVEDYVALPTISSNYYTVEGWYTNSAATVRAAPISVGSVENKTFYLKLSMRKYFVYFDGNSGGSFAPIQSNYNEYITLPTCKRNGYLGTWNYWGFLTSDQKTSNFGMSYKVTGNVSFTAQWKRIYNISYENLVYGELKATVISGGKDAPKYYFEGEGLDLTKIYAQFERNRNLEFLGWYTTMDFTSRRDKIMSSERGNVTVYAKWNNRNIYFRDGEYTITDSGRFKQSYDTINIFGNYKYEDLKALGVKKIKLDITLTMWKVNDGYQYVILYDASDSVCFFEEKYDIGSGRYVKHICITLDLEAVKNYDTLRVRYSASGAGADTWKNNDMSVVTTYE